MSDDAPRAARVGSASWLDKRLVLGVLLVVGSVLAGARVLAAADTSQQVWSASRDLAAGTVLSEADLTLSRARLFDTSARYVAGAKPVGYVLQRAVSDQELVPVDALSAPGGDLPRREVTVPVPAGHLPPDLARGEQVDLYVTPDDKAAERAKASGRAVQGQTRLVLSALTVADVARDGGLGASGQELPVVLAVSPDQVLLVVQALSDGRIDLVRVPPSQQAPLVTAASAR